MINAIASTEPVLRLYFPNTIADIISKYHSFCFYNRPKLDRFDLDILQLNTVHKDMRKKVFSVIHSDVNLYSKLCKHIKSITCAIKLPGDKDIIVTGTTFGTVMYWEKKYKLRTTYNYVSEVTSNISSSSSSSSNSSSIVRIAVNNNILATYSTDSVIRIFINSKIKHVVTNLEVDICTICGLKCSIVKCSIDNGLTLVKTRVNEYNSTESSYSLVLMMNNTLLFCNGTKLVYCNNFEKEELTWIFLVNAIFVTKIFDNKIAYISGNLIHFLYLCKSEFKEYGTLVNKQLIRLEKNYNSMELLEGKLLISNYEYNSSQC